jgi:type VI secretion system secreted protein Hcp
MFARVERDGQRFQFGVAGSPVASPEVPMATTEADVHPVHDTALHLVGVGGRCYVARMTMTFNMDIETAGGEVVEGFTSVTSHDRAGMECFSFYQGIESQREKGTGFSTGRRNAKPVEVKKRVCKATPVLSRILCNNEAITVTFRFFQSNIEGTGVTDNFFNITLEGARICSQDIVSGDASDPEFHDKPMVECLKFVYERITWEDLLFSKIHSDEWKTSEA